MGDRPKARDGTGNAADAAAAAWKETPPPLPLPPGVSVSQLPGMLRPAAERPPHHSKAGWPPSSLQQGYIAGPERLRPRATRKDAADASAASSAASAAVPIKAPEEDAAKTLSVSSAASTATPHLPPEEDVAKALAVSSAAGASTSNTPLEEDVAKTLAVSSAASAATPPEEDVAKALAESSAASAATPNMPPEEDVAKTLAVSSAASAATPPEEDAAQALVSSAASAASPNAPSDEEAAHASAASISICATDPEASFEATWHAELRASASSPVKDSEPAASCEAQPEDVGKMLPTSCLVLLDDPSKEATPLWQEQADSAIQNQLSGVLTDINSLSSECDRLFQDCATSAGNGSASVDAEKLHELTQRLVDRFGARGEKTLENIGHIYAAATSGGHGQGVGKLELRGYVAAVLTQVLRELESRVEGDGEKKGAEADASQEASSADGFDPGQLGVMDGLQGLFQQFSFKFSD
eukprot:TRINITY_DN17675_c0_g1_i1.p1 TRINITY_DN17675_c0_g1~~TRINITY_DN17675_c0_g1_i1.p1  ORF type:complete len:502 (-),score=123.36 TRINITY_DN17675_c0_g1_i1:51-1463(-)